jgi:hypothetical protein
MFFVLYLMSAKAPLKSHWGGSSAREGWAAALEQAFKQKLDQGIRLALRWGSIAFKKNRLNTMSSQAFTEDLSMRNLGGLCLPLGDFSDENERAAEMCDDLLDLWNVADLIFIY